MKVLIAEDDIHICHGLRDLLENEGYGTVTVTDGIDALSAFIREQPDLVLLDIMMPGCDGYRVCADIRQRDPDVPVIFISAKSEEIDRVVGLDLGADDFIVKPFGVREVSARIRAVTRRSLRRQGPDSALPAPFALADWMVYPAELRARRDGECIDLSLRDVAILQYFHTHRGQVVSREALFNACWGRNYLPNSRTLDQHIARLRKLLEPEPHSPRIILTVHGVGYRYDG